MNIIDKYTNIDKEKRSTLFRRLANLPLENQVQVFKQCINFQHMHKVELKVLTNAQVLLVSLTEALYTFTEKSNIARYDIQAACQRSRKREIIQVNLVKSRHKRKATLREVLFKAKNWTLIRKLRIVDKLTYPEIADYLRTYHKIKVESSYISKLWKEKENLDI